MQNTKPLKVGVPTRSALDPTLDYDGFPLRMNRLKVAVSNACSMIGMNHLKVKGKKQ